MIKPAGALGYRPQEPPAGFASWKEWYLSLGVPADELPYDDWVDRLVDPDAWGPADLVPARARGQVWRVKNQSGPERRPTASRKHNKC